MARVIKRLGGDVSAIYSIGRRDGRPLARPARPSGRCEPDFPIAQETREDFFVNEIATGQPYRFILPGPELVESEWQECLQLLSRLEPFPRFLVGSGSLPGGVPDDFYARVARIAKQLRRHDDSWTPRVARLLLQLPKAST